MPHISAANNAAPAWLDPAVVRKPVHLSADDREQIQTHLQHERNRDILDLATTPVGLRQAERRAVYLSDIRAGDAEASALVNRLDALPNDIRDIICDHAIDDAYASAVFAPDARPAIAIGAVTANHENIHAAELARRSAVPGRIFEESFARAIGSSMEAEQDGSAPNLVVPFRKTSDGRTVHARSVYSGDPSRSAIARFEANGDEVRDFQHAGNANYRLPIMEEAIPLFLDAPIWGGIPPAYTFADGIMEVSNRDMQRAMGTNKAPIIFVRRAAQTPNTFTKHVMDELARGIRAERRDPNDIALITGTAMNWSDPAIANVDTTHLSVARRTDRIRANGQQKPPVYAAGDSAYELEATPLRIRGDELMRVHQIVDKSKRAILKSIELLGDVPQRNAVA